MQYNNRSRVEKKLKNQSLEASLLRRKEVIKAKQAHKAQGIPIQKQTMAMFTCGEAFSLDDIFGKLPPPPSIGGTIMMEGGEDPASFQQLSVEEQLPILKRELVSFKDAVRIKDVDLEDLRQELKFYTIKNEELMDVVNTFRCPSDTKSYELMRMKSEQNSELTLQVHSLRDLLDKSGTEIDQLQHQITTHVAANNALSSVKTVNQRLQVQLNGLAKTLDNVTVSSVDIPSEWINAPWMMKAIGGIADGEKKGYNNNSKDDSGNSSHSTTIQTITRKVIAMEADRQRLLKESMLIHQSDTSKENRIVELERQVHQMQYDQNEVQATNSSLRKQMMVREGKITALEKLFQSINANRSSDTNTDVIDYDDDSSADDEDMEDVDIGSTATGVGQQQNFDDIFTNIWAKFSGDTTPVVVKTNNINRRQNTATNTMIVGGPFTVKEQYESSQLIVTDLTARLEESIIQSTSYKKKAELREGLLRDVIQQYKELQAEHSASKDHLRKMKHKIAVLLQFEQERAEERKVAQEKEDASSSSPNNEAKTVDTLKGANTTTASQQRHEFLEDHSRTFDTSDCSTGSSENPCYGNDDGSTASSSLYTTNGLDKKFVLEDYKRLENECDRLQHEYDTAISMITSLEEQLKEAESEIYENQKASTEKGHKIAVLQKEKFVLQERIIDVTAKIAETQSTHTKCSIEVDSDLKSVESNVALRIAQIESCTPASETTEDEDEDYYYEEEEEDGDEDEDKTDEDTTAGDNRTEEEEDYYYYEVIEEDEGETGEDDTTTTTTGMEKPTDLVSSSESSAETDGDTVTATSDYQVEILAADYQVEILSKENQQL